MLQAFFPDAGYNATVPWPFAKLAELWVNGVPVDWTKVYAQTTPPRMSLPVYPFAKERYWHDTAAAGPMAAAATLQSDALARLAVEETGYGVVEDKIQKNLLKEPYWKERAKQI